MQIRVIRGAGDRQGPSIVDSLLTDNSVGRERGITEINDSVSKKIQDGNCPLLPFIDTGTIAQIAEDREVNRGKVVFFSQTVDIDQSGKRYYPTSSIKIERIEE